MMMAVEFLGNITKYRRGGGGHTNNNNYQSVLVISLPSGVVVGRKTEREKSARWWHELLSWYSTGARRVIVVIARASGIGGGRETDWPRVEITARTDVLPCCRHLPFRATARRSDPRAIGGGGSD